MITTCFPEKSQLMSSLLTDTYGLFKISFLRWTKKLRQQIKNEDEPPKNDLKNKDEPKKEDNLSKKMTILKGKWYQKGRPTQKLNQFKIWRWPENVRKTKKMKNETTLNHEAWLFLTVVVHVDSLWKQFNLDVE